jgi:hypothetical protein
VQQVVTQAAVNTTVHDNIVIFPGAASLNFDILKFSITPGQPYEGTSTTGYSMNMRAGRKGSAVPAADFNNGLYLDNTMGLDALWPVTQFPSDLNFVGIGVLTIVFPNKNTHTCQDMRVAQVRKQ